MPRVVVKPDLEREVDAWDGTALAKFLATIEGHRWEEPFPRGRHVRPPPQRAARLGWSSVDLKKGTVHIERALVEVHGRPEWSDGKNARSRRTIPIDPTMVMALTVNRRFQAEERLATGAA